MLCRALVLAIVGSAVTISGASAVVVGGDVTAYSGTLSNAQFIILDLPFTPTNGNINTVGNDNFQKPHLYAFNEDQNITLDRDVEVNVGTDLLEGQMVASHYVFFDPKASRSQKGYVEFDAKVLGIATSTALLNASDFLANTLVTYLMPGLRGLEKGDHATIDKDNPFRINVDWDASTPGDYIRVFTERSPLAAVPLPAALPLLTGALGYLGWIGWRRRRRGSSRGPIRSTI